MLPFDIWIIVKIFFLIGLGVYVAFAVIVVRQVYLMTTTLRFGLEFFVRLIGWAHLFVALTIFLIAFVTL